MVGFVERGPDLPGMADPDHVPVVTGIRFPSIFCSARPVRKEPPSSADVQIPLYVEGVKFQGSKSSIRIFWVAGCEGFECRFQIGERLHAVDIDGLDQRCDATPFATAFVVAGEERGFSIEGDRTDEVLDIVRGDLDAPARQESMQPVPVA